MCPCFQPLRNARGEASGGYANPEPELRPGTRAHPTPNRTLNVQAEGSADGSSDDEDSDAESGSSGEASEDEMSDGELQEMAASASELATKRRRLS